MSFDRIEKVSTVINIIIINNDYYIFYSFFLFRLDLLITIFSKTFDILNMLVN